MSCEKSVFVNDLFNRIAPVYDFLNDVMSLYKHKQWKKETVDMLKLQPDQSFLDLCCGSGDISLIALNSVQNLNLTAVDFSVEMLKIASQKLKNYSQVELLQADAMNLPFEDASFDALAISFGLRNLRDYPEALKEMNRVLKANGKMVNIDFGKPKMHICAFLFSFYFDFIVPVLGLIFKNLKAYTYLAQSIKKFPSPIEIKKIMLEAGFKEVQVKDLFFGFVSIQLAVK